MTAPSPKQIAPPQPVNQALNTPLPDKGTESQNASKPHSIELDHLKQINISDALETANESTIGNEGFSIGDEIPIGSENPIGETELLTSDQFFEGMFVPLHAMPAAMLHLESLPIKPHEMQSARAASDAIYDIALETPMFRFLIEPSNIWMQRAFVILAYALPKSRAVMMELRARQAKPAQAHEEPLQNDEKE